MQRGHVAPPRPARPAVGLRVDIHGAHRKQTTSRRAKRGDTFVLASYIVFQDLYSEVLRFRTYPQEDPASGRGNTGRDRACGSSELQKGAAVR